MIVYKEEMYIELHGRRLYVDRQGPLDGPAVVLLHHGLGSTQAWRSQTALLAQAGFNVIVYDRWGYGQSDPRPRLSVPSFDEDLDDLLGLLDELHLEQAALVGHSDGGTICLYFAAAHPHRVTAVVVVAAHIYVEEKMLPGIEGVRWAFENDPRMRAGLRRMHGEKTDQVFYHWYRGWMRPEIIGWDMRPLLRSITCPVWVVQGLQDEHASAQHARDLAQALPKSQLWLLKDANHMLPQESGAAFNPRLLAFLQAALHPGSNGHHTSPEASRNG